MPWALIPVGQGFPVLLAGHVGDELAGLGLDVEVLTVAQCGPDLPVYANLVIFLDPDQIVGSEDVAPVQAVVRKWRGTRHTNLGLVLRGHARPFKSGTVALVGRSAQVHKLLHFVGACTPHPLNMEGEVLDLFSRFHASPAELEKARSAITPRAGRSLEQLERWNLRREDAPDVVEVLNELRTVVENDHRGNAHRPVGSLDANAMTLVLDGRLDELFEVCGQALLLSMQQMLTYMFRRRVLPALESRLPHVRRPRGYETTDLHELYVAACFLAGIH